MKDTLTTKALTTALCVSLLAGSMNSCQNMNDEILTQTQGGVAGGLAAGLVVGGVAALVSGGDLETALAAGGAAFVAGAFAGVAWANSVVKEKQEYASTEEYLNANIQQLDSRIADASKYNENLKKSIAAKQQEKDKYSRFQYTRLAQNISTNISLIDQDIRTAQLAIDEAGGTDVATLRQKLVALESERDTLIRNRDDLVALQFKPAPVF